MKVNIDINFDDVNYDEIEEVDELTLYDTIDGWIDEPISYEDTTAMDIMSKHMSYGIVKEDETDEDEEVYLDMEDHYHGVISRYDYLIKQVDRWFYDGSIDKFIHGEIHHVLDYVVYDEHSIQYRCRDRKTVERYPEK